MICNRFIQFLTLNLILCICTPSLGDIIHVPDDYETIQEATENAENGDTIMVAPGEYPRAAGFVHEPSPIWFIGDPNHETIIDLGGDRHNGFSSQYARIFVENFVIRNNSGGRPGVGLFRTHGEVRNCVFQDLSVAITISEGSALVERCHFENNAWNTHLDLNEDETIFRYNFISECTFGIDIGYGRSALIENNTIVNTPNAIIVRGSEGLCHIRNNMVSGCDVAITLIAGLLDNQIIDEFVARRLAISYNCLWDNEMNFLAILSDTTDVFNPSPGDGMIDENPLFVDPDNDDYHLTADSPCIDAGDPESESDPDSTRADIGAFYFHLYPEIEIEPETIEFSDVQTGVSDSTTLSIRNTGRAPLHIIRQYIEPIESPFTIGNGGGDFNLDPDSTHLTWIVFSPEIQDEYEAAYCIESNDPDENSLEIPLYGTALRVKQEGGGLPIELKIVDIFPNPFNNSVIVQFTLSSNNDITMKVIDLNGRVVKMLLTHEKFSLGHHSIIWNASDIPSGIYLVNIESASKTDTRKILLIH
ncbi:MAG: T9SS type A sorting domain-containing protein [Candidatus Hatepunaea meridiana]|nr:T9SS type A sorting domain-containing protein [Candidatus Hatepunaea meridiana]